SKTAATGKWEKGPGMKLFKMINDTLGEKPIIAEDLGFLTPEVEKLLKESTYPGMKILLFAFDSKEENDYLPHKYDFNSVAYTGTHDNMTVLGWYRAAEEEDKQNCLEYLDTLNIETYEINWKFIEAVWATKSQLVLTQAQDLLGLDNIARMNTPSTSEGNWSWRLKKDELDHLLAKKIAEITAKNGR
ncbi:MAG: 4-alpha-glucanotransferase, partial [Fusobacteriaceae bacterium]